MSFHTCHYFLFAQLTMSYRFVSIVSIFLFHLCFCVLCSTIMSASLKIFALLTTVVSASDINVKYYFGSRSSDRHR